MFSGFKNDGDGDMTTTALLLFLLLQHSNSSKTLGPTNKTFYKKSIWNLSLGDVLKPQLPFKSWVNSMLLWVLDLIRCVVIQYPYLINWTIINCNFFLAYFLIFFLILWRSFWGSLSWIWTLKLWPFYIDLYIRPNKFLIWVRDVIIFLWRQMLIIGYPNLKMMLNLGIIILPRKRMENWI